MIIGNNIFGVVLYSVVGYGKSEWIIFIGGV